MKGYLLLLVAMPIAGLALAIRGLRGRRVGREPFCSHCGYNLTGLTSLQCPECGRALNRNRAIVVGRRQRRVWSAMVGCLVLLASSGYLARVGIPYLQQHRYQLYPFSWVLRSATKDVADAMHELERRHRVGRLSKTQADTLARVALAQQALLPRPILSDNWATLLELMNAAGRLSPAQSAQYYQQLILFSIVPIPPVKFGAPMSVGYGKDSRAPRGVYTAYFLDENWTFDNQPGLKGVWGYSIWPADGGQTLSFIPLKKMPMLAPGRHRLVHSFRLRLYRVNLLAGAHLRVDPEKDVPINEQQFRQVREFDVVAPEPPASTNDMAR